MKKKFLAALLIASSLCLSACSDEVVFTNPDELSGQNEEAVAVEETVTLEDVETVSSVDETVDTASIRQRGVAGYVNGSVYRNEFFGIQYAPAAGYAFLSADDIEKIGNLSSELLDDESIRESLESGQTVIDFLLTDVLMQNSVTCTLGKMSNSSFTTEEVEARIDELVPVLTQVYESKGFEDLICERSDVTFLDKETPCISISGSFSGTEIKMVQVFLVKEGYSATITIQADTDEKISTLVSMFTNLE